MAISPQRLTIYLYSAHRAVIFATAQLSCLVGHWCNQGEHVLCLLFNSKYSPYKNSDKRI